MSEKSAVIVGSMNMDLVAKTRRFPRPGETIVGESFYTSFGGKGANQAVTIARLGLPVNFVGCVGDDAFGREMVAHAGNEGVDTTDIRIANGCPSGTALIVVNAEGQNQIIITHGANNQLSPKDVDKAEEIIVRAAVVVAQFEIPFETVQHAIDLAHTHGVPVILNPAPALPHSVDASLLRKVSMLVPNEVEAEAFSGVNADNPDFASETIRNLREKGVQTAIITLGEKGCIVADSKNEWRIPAFKVYVEDTTAAGDAFVGALAAGYHFFAELPALAKFASTVAALTVTRKGAQSSLPNRHEVEHFIRAHAPELLEEFRAMTREK